MLLNSKEIYIDSYSHLVTEIFASGIEDWTAAILQAVADANPGDTLTLPNIRPYGTSTTIIINKAVSIVGGSRLIAHHSNTALLFRPDSKPNFGGADGDRSNIERLNIDISVEKHKKDWTDNSIGIHIYNSYFGVFKFPRIIDFTTQVIMEAEKIPELSPASQGSSYNTIYIGRMENHRYGIILKSRFNSGWTTENTFYGGSFGNGYGVPADNFQILFDSDEMGWNNNNKFYNMSFEGHYTRCIIGNFTMNNDFYSCRYEMPKMIEFLNWGVSTQNNGVFNGYGLDESTLSKIKDAGRYNRVSATHGHKVGYVEYYDGEFFSFIKNGEKIKPISGKSITPIGNSPQQVQYITDGKIIIDLSIARDFYFIIQSDVTSISFVNIPTPRRGIEFSLHFTQDSASGYSITGFPNELKFGRTGAGFPEKRKYGIDAYQIKSTAEANIFFAVMYQFKS